MVDDRRGHVPALPAGLRRAVVEVDVLAVHPEARVPAADLVEHRAAQQQERAEHPVRLHRLGRALVEQVVAALVAEGGKSSRSGVRRTSVAPTVGKERRVACQGPSG